jgi:uncharacterized protein
MIGQFTVSQRNNGEYQFALKAGNGEVILASQGYKSHRSCLNGVNSVRRNSADLDRFVRHKASNGQYYFVLTAANGKVIGQSELYRRETSCKNGIASVAHNAPRAAVEDRTH